MSAMASQISSVSGGKCFHLMTSLWFNGCAVQDHRCLTDSRTWKCAWSEKQNTFQICFKHFSTLLRFWTHITTALLKCVQWYESVHQCCTRCAKRRSFVPVVLVRPCLPDQDDWDNGRKITSIMNARPHVKKQHRDVNYNLILLINWRKNLISGTTTRFGPAISLLRITRRQIRYITLKWQCHYLG